MTECLDGEDTREREVWGPLINFPTHRSPRPGPRHPWEAVLPEALPFPLWPDAPRGALDRPQCPRWTRRANARQGCQWPFVKGGRNRKMEDFAELEREPLWTGRAWRVPLRGSLSGKRHSLFWGPSQSRKLSGGSGGGRRRGPAPDPTGPALPFGPASRRPAPPLTPPSAAGSCWSSPAWCCRCSPPSRSTRRARRARSTSW